MRGRSAIWSPRSGSGRRARRLGRRPRRGARAGGVPARLVALARRHDPDQRAVGRAGATSPMIAAASSPAARSALSIAELRSAAPRAAALPRSGDRRAGRAPPGAPRPAPRAWPVARERSPDARCCGCRGPAVPPRRGSAGIAARSSSAEALLARSISPRCPARPKPVTSVAAEGRDGIIARAAAPLERSIEAAVASTHSPRARPACRPAGSHRCRAAWSG